MKNVSTHLPAVAAITLAASFWCAKVVAMTPAELKKNLADGVKITVIDVRNTATFQKGHIPGAVNIPASLIPQKTLPPLGRVVVCDEGLGQTFAATSVGELNKKKGISAEVLEGGFAGWEAYQGTSTRESGLQHEELNLITYDQLKKASPTDLVLVDLRKPRAQVRQADGAAAPPPLTDLGKEFPQTQVTRSPFDLPQLRQSESGGVKPLLVLIDDGGADNSALEMARVLKANGVRRVVILAGGEEILSRAGKPGLQRRGVVVGESRK